MPIQVKVRLLKETYTVDLDPEAPPVQFREGIEAATGVPPGEMFYFWNFLITLLKMLKPQFCHSVLRK